MEIEDNIPIPGKRCNILAKLEIGQSVIYKQSATPLAYEASRSAMKRIEASTGNKYVLKRLKDEGVCRIWRIA